MVKRKVYILMYGYDDRDPYDGMDYENIVRIYTDEEKANKVCERLNKPHVEAWEQKLKWDKEYGSIRDIVADRLAEKYKYLDVDSLTKRQQRKFYENKNKERYELTKEYRSKLPPKPEVDEDLLNGSYFVTEGIMKE